MTAAEPEVARGKKFTAIWIVPIIAVVIGCTLLTGGYGSVIGAKFGALIFCTVQMGIFYTGVDIDWFKVFIGAMMLVAVMVNNFIRRRATESRA